MILAVAAEYLSAAEHIKNLFLCCGGLGIFLYGIHVILEGLGEASGNRIRQLLDTLTSNRILAIFFGAVVTALTQSSGVTAVAVVGLVHAGFMGLGQAAGVIMGGSIGVCLMSWVHAMELLDDASLVLDPSLYAPLAVAIGAVLVTVGRQPVKQLAGRFLVGFGLLFLGMDFLKNVLTAYGQQPYFQDMMELSGEIPLVGIAVGILLAALVQNSAAVMGLLPMAAAAGVTVTTASAVYLGLGVNVGMCVSALLASVRVSRLARQAAVFQLCYSILGTLLLGIGAVLLFQLGAVDGSAPVNDALTAAAFAGAQAVYAILMLPLVGPCLKLTRKLVSGNGSAKVEYGGDRLSVEPKWEPSSPERAVKDAVEELSRMSQLALDQIRLAMEAVYDGDHDKIKKVYDNEETVIQLGKRLTEYLAAANRLSMSEHRRLVISNLFFTVNDIKHAARHGKNIAEHAEIMIRDHVTLTSAGMEDLKAVAGKATDAFSCAALARESGSLDDVRRVVSLSDDVDMLEEEMRDRALSRLSERACGVSSSVIVLDILENLVGIANRAVSMVGYVKDEM